MLCIAMPSAMANSTPQSEVNLSSSGDLDNLIIFLLDKKSSDEIIRLNYTLTGEPTSIELLIDFYYSSALSIRPTDNRCTARPEETKIICDLRLVDSLIDDFKLFKFRPSLSQRETLSGYQKTILKWIVAHEIGHITNMHKASDFSEPKKGLLIYSEAQQRMELEADEYAVKLIGNLEAANVHEYGVILDIANSLIVRSLCPKTYPDICEEINPGVGLYYNSSSQAPIRIKAGGRHPEFIARFVRIVYLAGLGTEQNSINYLARQIIDKFQIKEDSGDWSAIGKAMDTHN